MVWLSAVRVGENARLSKDVGEVLIVLISDGKANVSLRQSLVAPTEESPQRAVLSEIRQEVLGIATAIRRLGIELLVIDTSHRHLPSDLGCGTGSFALMAVSSHFQSQPHRRSSATTREWLAQRPHSRF